MSNSVLALHLIGVLQKDILKKCRHVTHQMFHKYLLLTNVGISASLSFLGDIIQQYYEIFRDTNRQWEKGRTFRMTTSGATVGALCHFWYLYLDRKFPGRTLKMALMKVAVDQLVCSPLYITAFFATTCVMEGASFNDFKNEMIHKWWRLYLAEWVVWPPAQVINFYFLPTRYRVLYDNVISLGYDVFTSYVKNELPLDDTDAGTKEDTTKICSNDDCDR